MLAAGLLRSVAQPGAAIGRMLRIGLACVLAGWVWGGFQPVVGLGILGEPSVDAAWVFPINKMLWSSSYVLYTGGLALILLAVCMRLIDLRASGLPGWARPFIWLGSNAIFAYLASGLVAKTLHTITLTDGTSLWAWGYRNLAEPWIPIPPVASLLYSIAYLLPWFLICWWMYQRKMFIRL
jgi:predicted acyltransferase